MQRKPSVLMASYRVRGDRRYGEFFGWNDPNGFGLALIVHLADWSTKKRECDIPPNMSLDDLSKVRLFYGPKDSQGNYEIKIVAPRYVWDKAKQALSDILDSLVSIQGLLV